MISVFRREADENYDLLGYYAASSGNFLPKSREKLLVPPQGWPLETGPTLEYGTDSLSRNVGKGLTLLVA